MIRRERLSGSSMIAACAPLGRGFGIVADLGFRSPQASYTSAEADYLRAPLRGGQSPLVARLPLLPRLSFVKFLNVQLFSR